MANLRAAFFITGEISLDSEEFIEDSSTGAFYKKFAIDYKNWNGGQALPSPPGHALVCFVPDKVNPGANADVFAITEHGNDENHVWGVVSRIDGKPWGVPLRIGFTAICGR